MPTRGWPILNAISQEPGEGIGSLRMRRAGGAWAKKTGGGGEEKIRGAEFAPRTRRRRRRIS